MIINNCETPKAVLVGNPNLIVHNNISKLMLNYQARLSPDNKQAIAYYDLALSPKTGKHLKKNFNEDTYQIIEYCQNNNISVVACTNPDFYKFATGSKQFMPNMGKSIDGIGRYEGYQIVPVLNFYMLHSQPQRLEELISSVNTLDDVLNGTYVEDKMLIDDVTINVLTTKVEVREALKKLSKEPKVALDIETTGLILGKDRIITIAIAPNQEESYVFPTCIEYSDDWIQIRAMLIDWFIKYKGEQLWYNFMFDGGFILRELLEIDLYDKEELYSVLNGWNITDVMHIKYLCVNGLARTPLGLKDTVMQYYGDYDASIDQSRLLDYTYDEVGKYNGYDTTATFLAYNLYYPQMVEDEQEDIFNSYYKPSLITLIKMKYEGAIIDFDKLNKADDELSELLGKEYKILEENEHIIDVQDDLNYNAMFKYNSTHVKQKTVSGFDEKFNPNSTVHKVLLFIDTWGLNVLETTKTGNPSLGKAIIKQYADVEQDESKKEVMTALLSIADTNKVKTSFVDSIKRLVVQDSKGKYRIHSNFKLHGTVSGRISVSDINSQQIPSNSTYAKLIKGLFIAPKGFLFAGSDYNALESRIQGIVANDPVMLQMVKDDIDSHSYYTSHYYATELKERGLPTNGVNQEEADLIKKEASDLRNMSKPTTFSCAYNGTHFTVMKSLGISEVAAKALVEKYHEIHKATFSFYDKETEKAKKVGYYLLGTGLKVRCPELQSTEDKVVKQAERSGTNALFQGYGQLMIKAINRFQNWIEANGYANDIIVQLTVHDSLYLLLKEDLELIKEVNKVLIDIMCEDFIGDQQIPLAAELDLGYSWADQRTITNSCGIEEIKRVLYETEEKD